MLDYYGIGINVKKLNKLAKLPTRGSEYAAGYDLYAATAGPIEIQPHTTIKIGTGLSFELPQGTFAAIFPRSGIATKRGLRPANCVGVVDSDYRGEILVPLYNRSREDKTVEPGERIAQLVITPVLLPDVEETDLLSSTERGAGGFGSSG